MIENLPLLTPDTSRSAKTVAHCHNRLAARRRKLEASHHRPSQRAAAVERLLLAGLCVVYLVSMADNLLSIVGAL